VSGHAFLDVAGGARGAHVLAASVPEAPGGALRIVMPAGAPAFGYRHLADAVEPIHVERVDLESPEPDGGCLFRAVLRGTGCSPLEIRATPIASIPVVRQLPRGRTAHYRLAFCRYHAGGTVAGSGWVELTRPPAGEGGDRPS
jgi:hypothetical protein